MLDLFYQNRINTKEYIYVIFSQEQQKINIIIFNVEKNEYAVLILR
jgi:hypothetical protein